MPIKDFFNPKSVLSVYFRLVFVSSRLASSLAMVRKASSECLKKVLLPPFFFHLLGNTVKKK